MTDDDPSDKLNSHCEIHRPIQGGHADRLNSVVFQRPARGSLQQRSCSRRGSPTVYSVTEFNRKRAAKDHFLSEVLAGPRLLVLGSENDLGKAPR